MFAWVCVSGTVWMQFLQRPGEGIGCPGAGVSDGLCAVMWMLETKPLASVRANFFLPSKPSLQHQLPDTIQSIFFQRKIIINNIISFWRNYLLMHFLVSFHWWTYCKMSYTKIMSKLLLYYSITQAWNMFSKSNILYKNLSINIIWVRITQIL